MNKLVIGIDFDGTCVEHMYPYVGPDVPDAERVIRRIAENGHKIILYTMRYDNEKHGHVLSDAVDWFGDKNLFLYGVNVNPTQHAWTGSPKAYCNIYIDDAALGCPLMDGINGPRMMVDWKEVERILEDRGILGLRQEYDFDDLKRVEK